MEKKETASDRYDKRMAVRIGLKLNKGTDADILEWLDKQPNKQGAIKELIREHLKK